MSSGRLTAGLTHVIVLRAVAAPVNQLSPERAMRVRSAAPGRAKVQPPRQDFRQACRRLDTCNFCTGGLAGFPEIFGNTFPRDTLKEYQWHGWHSVQSHKCERQCTRTQ